MKRLNADSEPVDRDSEGAGVAAVVRQSAGRSPGAGAGDQSRAEHLRRLGGTLTRLPRYLKLGATLLADPRLSRRRKAVLAGAAAYVISPIDLVPGIIPIAGQLDDLALLLVALRLALRGLPTAEAAAHLTRAGLPYSALDEDLAVVRSTAGWLVRGTATKARWIGRGAFAAARSGATRIAELRR